MIKWKRIIHPAFESLKESYKWNKPFLKLLDEDKMFPFQTALHTYLLSKWAYISFYIDGTVKYSIVCRGLVGEKKWELSFMEKEIRFKTLKEAKNYLETI